MITNVVSTQCNT